MKEVRKQQHNSNKYRYILATRTKYSWQKSHKNRILGSRKRMKILLVIRARVMTSDVINIHSIA